MAELDTSYRTPRHRPGMDPNTRRLALIASGIGASLMLMVGAWSLIGGKSDGVPVVEADARPLRVKPEGGRQALDMAEPADPRHQALAPTPEAPKPEALKAQAERAAAERLAAERQAAEKLASDRLAAERAAAERQATERAPPPPASAGAPQASPRTSTAQATAVPRPPAQPVALTAPIPAAPRPTSPPRAAQPAAPAPQAGRTQVQLAAVRSQQAALNEWARLERRMPDILGGRQPAVIRFERDGKTIWRLRTGGFADTAQARGFCEKVRAKGGSCTVAAF